MTLKQALILALICSAISSAVTRFYWPVVQTKTVEKTNDVYHNDIQTVLRIVKEPSGAVESTTTTIDNSVRVDTTDKSLETLKRPDWLVGATIGTDFVSSLPIYGVHVQRRVLGPFWLGIGVNTTHQATLSLEMEF